MEITSSRVELVVRSVNKLSVSLTGEEPAELIEAADRWSRFSQAERRFRALVSLLGRGMGVAEADLTWFAAPLAVEDYHTPTGTSGCVLEVQAQPLTGRLLWTDEGMAWVGRKCRKLHGDLLDIAAEYVVEVGQGEKYVPSNAKRFVPQVPSSSLPWGTQIPLRF